MSDLSSAVLIISFDAQTGDLHDDNAVEPFVASNLKFYPPPLCLFFFSRHANDLKVIAETQTR